MVVRTLRIYQTFILQQHRSKRTVDRRRSHSTKKMKAIHNDIYMNTRSSDLINTSQDRWMIYLSGDVVMYVA